MPLIYPLMLGGGSLVGIILIYAFGIDRIQRPPAWFWFLCVIPLSIGVMLATIWALRHGYLSLDHALSQPVRRDGVEFKIIMGGLLAPFLAVLFAIVAFFTKDWPRE